MAPYMREKKDSAALDTVFNILGNQRRRYICYSLLETSNNLVTVDELVADVLQMETTQERERGSL